MNMQFHFSPSTTYFLKHFNNYLNSTGMLYQKFFQNYRIFKKESITIKQFLHIVSLLNIEAQFNFDPQQTFNELAIKQNVINISHLKNMLAAVGKIVDDYKHAQAKALQQALNKKILDICKYKMQEYFRKTPNPIQVLRSFDSQNTMSLDCQDLNALLISTQIRQFQSKFYRNQMIQFILRHVAPQRRISFAKICPIFKIKNWQQLLKPLTQKYLKNNQDRQWSPDKKRASLSRQNKKNNYSQNCTQKVLKDKPLANESRNRKSIDKHIIKKTDVIEIDLAHFPNQLQNTARSFDINYPQAIKYYRMNVPSPIQHSSLHQLQQLLQNRLRFVDKNNPKTSQGQYKTSKQIFANKQYFIFQMAASVLVREASRVGLARQIQPKDIIQGSVGDCYFLSSIASIISIYPQIIAQRFLFNRNPANYFAITLFIDGEWKIFQTDDAFPCNGDVPVYAKPHYQEIWVMLLQKCWAKNVGSYAMIESGSSKQGFMSLTGAPCEIISKDKNSYSPDQLISILQKAHRNRYVASVSGSKELTQLDSQSRDQLGLISQHAYSITKILKIKGQIVVKLRNPWGKTTWKGDWSFQSPLWTQQLRIRCNYIKNPQDGSFYMPWKDFFRYFGEMVICKLNPTYLHSSLHVKIHLNKSTYLKLMVKTHGNYSLSIYQESKRKMKNQIQNYQYSQSRLIIMKKQSGKYVYIGAKATPKSQVTTVELQNLQPGQYVLNCKIWWKLWESREIIVTSYGIDHTNMSLLQAEIAEQFKTDLIQSYVEKHKGQGKIKNYDKYGLDATFQTNFNVQTGIGFVRMVNNSNKSFQSSQNFEMHGLKMIKSDTSPFQFKMQPKSCKSVGFFVMPSGYKYNSTEKILY